MLRRRTIGLLIALCVCAAVNAQQILPYAAPADDSVKATSELNRPRRATLWSTFVPGAGQIYNGKYWKAGLVYGGTAGLVYMFRTNTDSMNAYQEAYVARVDTSAATVDTRYPYLTDASVRSFRDYHRRLRDISILGFVGLYALQIIDANVDAHLYEFKVNDELSLRMEPEIRPLSYGQTRFGLRLQLRF